MTTLITADLHLDDRPLNRYRHRFMNEELPALLKMHKVDELIILGDFTEAKDRHSAQLVNEVVGYLHKLASICPVIAMRGNHDYVQAQFPFFRFLEMLPNITWINAPSIMVTKAFGKTIFLPHTVNHERDWNKIDTLPYRNIFAHNTFAGADSGHRILDGIPLDVLAGNGRRVIAGDIHKPQKIGNVTYVGAPYTVDFGDDYDPRALLIKDEKIIDVGIAGTRKVIWNVDWNGDVSTRDVPFEDGDIVRVQVAVTQADMQKWSEISNYIATAMSTRCKLSNYQILPEIKEQITTQRKSSQRSQNKSDIDHVRDYCEQHALDAHTRKMGEHLMRKV